MTVPITVRNPSAEEEQRKKICLEQLAQDRQKLLIRWPFVGGIIMRMELVAVRDDRLETACTDGNNIFVDIDFYSKLSKNERLFVLAHEVWHSILLHFARRRQRDPQLFNIACDIEIHFTLLEEKMQEPWVLPHSESWKTLSAEEIYEKLLDDPRYSKPESGSGSCRSDDDIANPNFGSSGSFDRHISEGDDTAASTRQAEANAAAAGKSEIVLDADFAPQVSKDTAEKVRGRVIASATQVERIQGKLPAYVKDLLETLMQPELPWQELLKQFVTSCYGGKRRWLPPARRHVWQGIYLPSMRDEQIRAAVAIDTSGSTANDLGKFFAELTELMKSFGRYELTVIQCDADIQKVEKFSDANTISGNHKWEVSGGGGTDFRPVFNYVAKKLTEPPELLIYFTDGYGTAPAEKPPYPVLWVLTQESCSPAEWGRQIIFKH